MLLTKSKSHLSDSALSCYLSFLKVGTITDFPLTLGPSLSSIILPTSDSALQSPPLASPSLAETEIGFN